jgi:hypothetical protein
MLLPLALEISYRGPNIGAQKQIILRDRCQAGETQKT